MRKVLMIISSDPRTSPRPAEAIRIATGLRAWEGLEIEIFLSGAASSLISRPTHELVDEELITQHLPALNESIMVEEAVAGSAEVKCRGITPDELANASAEADCVLNF